MNHLAQWCYSALLRVLALPIAGLLAWQAVRARDGRFLRQRLGIGYLTRADRPLWLHAASVGEVMAAHALLETLGRRYPSVPLVISTATPAGARVAAARLPKEVVHVYLPVDWPSAVHRFLRALAPRAALVMETELWPHLYQACHAARIPLVIVNGRLSPRSLHAGAWVKALQSATLRTVAAVLARSPVDAAGFVHLGAPATRVETIGNIKFAAPSKRTCRDPGMGRRYVLAASTHDDEERRIAAVWVHLTQADTLLVIAPRHPHRLAAILRQLAPLGLRVAVRSRGEPVSAHTQVYLADTLGELLDFMAAAEVVFIGGSLVPIGGHNLLEPARLGKALVLGPHMENFAAETALFLHRHAVVQIHDEAELATQLKHLLTDHTERERLGLAAQTLMQEHADIAERYADRITLVCDLGPAPR